MSNNEVFEALEVAAAAFPWDRIELDIHRTPEGAISYTLWLPQNEKLGFGSEITFGNSPMEAVDTMIKKVTPDKRDPAVAKEKKLAELKAQIVKLEAVVLGLPPYVPNRELALRAESLRAQTIDV